MHYFIYPTKDATIYSGSTPGKMESTNVEEQNTGLDEILEIDKWKAGTGLFPVVNEQSVSRILLQFDLSDVSSSIVDGTITNPTFSLKLYSTDTTTEIPLTYELYTHALSSSWEMGIGQKNDNPITSDGVTWYWRDVSGSLSWENSGSDFLESAVSQSFTFEKNDIDMDVTTIVNGWLDGRYPNNGFIIKRADSLENNGIEYGSAKFFSRDTHTIYVPKLDISWDDSNYDSGSLNPLDVSDGDINIYMKGIKAEYKQDSITRFNVGGRRRIISSQPATIVTSSGYLVTKYLPTTTYYSVKDYKTNEVIIPFGSNTKISCDSNGNYFNFRMSTLQRERFYKISYKITSGSNVHIFDDNQFQFKVVK